MTGFSRLLSRTAAAGLAAGMMVTAAQAVTINDEFDIASGGSFYYDGLVKTGSGGAGSYAVKFNAQTEGTGEFEASLLERYKGISDPVTVKWLDADDESELASTVFMRPIDSLSTMFTADALSQLLVISWEGSMPNKGFDFLVTGTTAAPIPLPAGAVLLLTGLGGLGYMRSRRSKQA